MVYCSKCGKKNDNDAEFCNKCGNSLKKTDSEDVDYKKLYRSGKALVVYAVALQSILRLILYLLE